MQETAVSLQEKRTAARFSIQLPVTLTSRHGNPISGQLIDFSETGLGLDLEQPLSPSEETQIQVTLPENQGTLQTRATIVWNTSSTAHGMFRHGARMLPMEASFHHALLTMKDSDCTYDNPSLFQDLILKKICVQPPYFALKNVVFNNDVVKADFDIEQPLISSQSVITGAEAGRHLAILGSCALAVKSTDKQQKYYLATSARFHQNVNLNHSEKSTHFKATASAEFLDKRMGRATTALFYENSEKILDLIVYYTIIPKPIFDRNNRSHLFKDETADPTPSPYGNCLICEKQVIMKDRKAIAHIGKVDKQWCPGHFPQYPALPVAILMYNLEYMADLLLKRFFSNQNLKYCFSNAIINSDMLAFHGDDLSFDVELIAISGDKYYFLSKVICNSTHLISTLNLTAQIL